MSKLNFLRSSNVIRAIINPEKVFTEMNARMLSKFKGTSIGLIKCRIGSRNIVYPTLEATIADIISLILPSKPLLNL